MWRRFFLTLLLFATIIVANEAVATIVRPLVVISPMNDSSSHNLSWDVSKELWQAIVHRLSQNKQLYLIHDDKNTSFCRDLLSFHDPFGGNTQWIKTKFQPNEFIVFTELLQHDEVLLHPVNSKECRREDSTAELNLKVRVRVFDIRNQTPQVILEEIVQKFHTIPKQFTQLNFHQVSHGEEEFEISPLGVFHEQLSKELAVQIEDYILMACR